MTHKHDTAFNKTYSPGHPSEDAAREAMKLMLKAGELTAANSPRVLPYHPSRDILLYAVVITRTNNL